MVLVNYQNLITINLNSNLDDSSDRKFLIPTAEVILTNIVKDKIIDKKNSTYEDGCFNSVL